MELITIFVTFAIILVIFLFARKRRTGDIKKTGEIIEATVTDLYHIPTKDVLAHNEAVMKIIAESTIKGMMYKFESKIYYYRNEPKIKAGDIVRIIVEMNNPARYYFDPYQEEY
ncbi:MAG: hypothetical protein H8E14_03135 [Candidatus Marinimicrobia bacterium]|nr:hypothetical protein [Candidatus Neomarinimicrobiota bacterium]